MGPSRILQFSDFQRRSVHQEQYVDKTGLHPRLCQDFGSVAEVCDKSFSEATDEKLEDAMEHVFGNHSELTRQEEIDNAFAALDEYLGKNDPTTPIRGCVNCGGVRFTTGHEGVSSTICVCSDCGVVQPGVDFSRYECNNYITRKTSNYKRVHHFHERVSQLLLHESSIPNAQFILIARKLCDGTYSVINKDAIRSVLRSLNLQIYIEKWLQIIWRVTDITPPTPGSVILQQLDGMFTELQQPFDAHKTDGRKNFLNYNYVFCRLFQEIGCPQFSMFFPLIKSKQKLKALDDMWKPMVESVGWKFKPLQTTPAFAVRLEPSDIYRMRKFFSSGELDPERCLLVSNAYAQRDFSVAISAPAEQQEGHTQKECRQLDHHLLPHISKRDQRLLRSIQVAERFQRQGLKCRRPPWHAASSLQPLPREPVLRLRGKLKVVRPLTIADS